MHISRIFTKFAYKLCIRVIRNYVFEHYKVTKNQRDAQLFKHNINQLFRRFSIPPTGFNNVNIINLLYILDFANIYTRGVTEVTGVTGVTLCDCRERLPRLPWLPLGCLNVISLGLVVLTLAKIWNMEVRNAEQLFVVWGKSSNFALGKKLGNGLSFPSAHRGK